MRIGIHWISDTRGPGKLEQFFEEFVMDTALDQQARPGDAGLPRRGENARYYPVHRIVYLGVSKDNVGGFTAQFQRYLLECLRSDRRYVPSGLFGPREGHFGNILMLYKICADLCAIACHYVENAFWQADLVHKPGQFQCRSRGKLGRFYDERVARGQCRSEFVGQKQQWRIPCRDTNTDSQRLVAGKI